MILTPKIRVGIWGLNLHILIFNPMVWFQFLVNKNQIMTKLKCCGKQRMQV